MAGGGKDVAQWLAAARAGSREALGELLEGCRRYLLLVADREVSPDLRAKAGPSDLVQNTFVEAQRDFGQFRGDSEAELLAWLRRLLLNNLANFARDFRQRQRRDVAREVPLDPGNSSALGGGGPAVDAASPSAEAVAHEQAQAVRQALQRLPEDYRRVLLLRYQEGRSYEEIGGLLQRTPEAARKLFARALERFQQEMEAEP